MTKTDAQRLAERYHSVRSYLACQQAILLTLLNSNYEIVISKPTKKALISSQVVKVIAISSGSERIDVVDIVEKHCKEIMEKDISNGISQSSAYRRFITNKSIENHHLLIDLLEGIGYFFNSSFSSGKHKSNRLQTINEIFYGKQLIITKDTIQTKGKSISNYMTKCISKNKQHTFHKKRPSIDIYDVINRVNFNYLINILSVVLFYIRNDETSRGIKEINKRMFQTIF